MPDQDDVPAKKDPDLEKDKEDALVINFEETPSIIVSPANPGTELVEQQVPPAPSDSQITLPDPLIISEGAGQTANDITKAKQKYIEQTGQIELLHQQIETFQQQRLRYQEQAEAAKHDHQVVSQELDKVEKAIRDSRARSSELAEDISKQNGVVAQLKTESDYLKDYIRLLKEKNDLMEKQENQALDARLAEMKAEFNTKKEWMEHEIANEKNRFRLDFEEFKRKIEEKAAQDRAEFENKTEHQRQQLLQAAEAKLADAENRGQGILLAAETTAAELRTGVEQSMRSNEEAARRKVIDILQAANQEAEELRRIISQDEIQSLKDKNASLAEMASAQKEAEKKCEEIISKAQMEAEDMTRMVSENSQEAIKEAQLKSSYLLKDANEQARQILEDAKKAAELEAKEFRDAISKEKKEIEDRNALDLEKYRLMSKQIVSDARERAKTIIDSAQLDYQFKVDELKIRERTIIQKAKKTAADITDDAEKRCEDMVVQAQERAANIEATMESIVVEARTEGQRIRAEAENYADKVRSEVPDPSLWNERLDELKVEYSKALMKEKRNIKVAMDNLIGEIYQQLPQRHQKNKVMLNFVKVLLNSQLENMGNPRHDQPTLDSNAMDEDLPDISDNYRRVD